MATDAYAKLISIIVEIVKKESKIDVCTAVIQPDKTFNYHGLHMHKDDYTLLCGHITSGDTIGVIKVDEEFYVIANTDLSDYQIHPDVQAKFDNAM